MTANERRSSALRTFLDRHPRLAKPQAWLKQRAESPLPATWLVLAVGMVILLLWAAQGKGLTPGQLTWLVLSCIGLAGACAWIISWE